MIDPPERISPCQLAALRYVEQTVRRRELTADRQLAEVLQRASCRWTAYDNAMALLPLHARVVVHFHPDRLGSNSNQTTVAEALLNEGVYRNQFETRLSSGSLSAIPGGARDNWERVLFGGAYHMEGVTDSERPKYGALELVRFPTGRFHVLDLAISFYDERFLRALHSHLWVVKIHELRSASVLSGG